MYQAFNNNIIVKVKNDSDLTKTVLEAEVLATTKDTEKLQGKTILAERRLFTQLGDTEEQNTTASGIVLGAKISYASLDIKHIVAVKE